MYIDLRYDRYNEDDVSVEKDTWYELEHFVQEYLGRENGCTVIGAKALSEAMSKASKGDASYKAELAKVTDSFMEKLHQVIRDKYIDAVRDRIGSAD